MTGDAVARLAALDTCAVSDAIDSLGLAGAAPGLAPLWEGGRIAGRVHTVALRPLLAGVVPPTGRHLGTTAIEAAGPGDVIVVANGGRTDSGAWGGLLSAAAHARGVAGVVVDGACRDVDEAVGLGFPVFARGVTPVSARGRTIEEATDIPVLVAGVRVAPGDYVVADCSGVIFVAEDAAARVLDAAESIAAREAAMLADIAAGTPVTQVLDRRYEEMTTRHVEAGADADADADADGRATATVGTEAEGGARAGR